MRHRFLAVIAMAGLLGSGVAAQAFSPAPANQAAAGLMLISGGCGPFAHRGFDDECRPNRGRDFDRPRYFGGEGRFDRRRDDRRERFGRDDGERRHDGYRPEFGRHHDDDRQED